MVANGISSGEEVVAAVSHPDIGAFVSLTVSLSGTDGVNIAEVSLVFADGLTEIVWSDEDFWLDGDDPDFPSSQTLT